MSIIVEPKNSRQKGLTSVEWSGILWKVEVNENVKRRLAGGLTGLLSTEHLTTECLGVGTRGERRDRAEREY